MISAERLEDLIYWLDRKWNRHKEEEDLEAANALREFSKLRAQGLSQEDREALHEAADFIEPRLMSSTLATSRGHEIAAILRRLGGQT